jgi:hypothetical protein
MLTLLRNKQVRAIFGIFCSGMDDDNICLFRLLIPIENMIIFICQNDGIVFFLQVN